MKIFRSLLITVACFFLFGCDKESNTTQDTSIGAFLFEDGFETQNNSLDELFPTNGKRWSKIQQTDPSNATNEISISDTEFSEGQNALRMLSNASDSQLSKIDIEKGGLQIGAGNKVTIKADFYITGTGSLQNLLLILSI